MSEDRWMPIDSAPKDGTRVIVGFDVGTEGWWSYTRGPDGQEHFEHHRTPTHWQPLPEPPEES